MKKKSVLIKSLLSLVMVLTVLVGTSAVGLSAIAAGSEEDVVGTRRYSISNPYQAVDWDTWGAYKGATHVHTEVSDGKMNYDDMVEYYYSKGFDVLAITDHGTVNYGWTSGKSRHTIFGYQLFALGSVDYLSSTRKSEIESGVGRNGQKMIDLYYGIELNGSSTSKTHINGYFADAGDGDMEMNASGVDGCITAVKKTNGKGGLNHINHVGEFMSANDAGTITEAQGIYDNSFCDDFADMVMNYGSLIGMELVNTADSRTKWDRYLYDEILKRVTARGKNFFGFCEDDAHEESDVDRNAQYFMMPSNTYANVRTSMETGAFFACSKNSRGLYYPELGNSCEGSTTSYPSVSNISYDEVHSRLTFEVTDATKAYMVANGTLVGTYDLTGSTENVTFDLNSYESTIGKYVRVYFTGAGGINYVQPFLITGTTLLETSTPKVIFNINQLVFTLNVYNSEAVVMQCTEVADYTVLYSLPQGEYTYTITKSGFVTQEGSFSITGEDVVQGFNKSIPISLLPSLELIIDEEEASVIQDSKYIYNLASLDSYFTDGVAHSNNSEYGEVVYTPTKNGYGTGSTISIIYEGQVFDTYTVIVYGDLDGDGIVDGTDYNLAYFLYCRADNGSLEDFVEEAMDVDGDGARDLIDCNNILQAGLYNYEVDQSISRNV